MEVNRFLDMINNSSNISMKIDDILNGNNLIPAITDAMEKRKFNITDSENNVLYTVKLTKPKEKQYYSGLNNYEIKVFDKNKALLFTKKTDSKKWDGWLTWEIEKCCKKSIKFLYSLEKDGRLEAMNNQLELFNQKYIDKTIQNVTHLNIDMIDGTALVNWFCCPVVEEFESKEFKDYYDLVDGLTMLKEKIIDSVSSMGYSIKNKNLNCELTLTPSLVRTYGNQEIYEWCMELTKERITKKIDRMLDDSEEVDYEGILGYGIFKSDWEQLAIERLGGFMKVKTELIMPKAHDKIQNKIEEMYYEKKELEEKIAQYEKLLGDVA